MKFIPIHGLLNFLYGNWCCQREKIYHHSPKCKVNVLEPLTECVTLPIKPIAWVRRDRGYAEGEKGGQIRFFTNLNSSDYSWLCRGGYSHWELSYRSLEVLEGVDFDRGSSKIGVGETRREEWYETFWTDLRHGGGVEHLYRAEYSVRRRMDWDGEA
jgi:hypothetical protein